MGDEVEIFVSTGLAIPTIPHSLEVIVPKVQTEKGMLGVVVWSALANRISLLQLWGCACGGR